MGIRCAGWFENTVR